MRLLSVYILVVLHYMMNDIKNLTTTNLKAVRGFTND